MAASPKVWNGSAIVKPLCGARCGIPVHSGRAERPVKMGRSGLLAKLWIRHPPRRLDGGLSLRVREPQRLLPVRIAVQIEDARLDGCILPKAGVHPVGLRPEVVVGPAHTV
jgi:hypothetical protein